MATGPVPDDTVWLAPELVVLAVEIVSKRSERTDRWLKPAEYAAAGIPRFWRIEPDDTVLQFRFVGSTYAEEGRVSLEDLLAGDVPDLRNRRAQVPSLTRCSTPPGDHELRDVKQRRS